jgi:hypothetical protein
MAEFELPAFDESDQPGIVGEPGDNSPSNSIEINDGVSGEAGEQVLGSETGDSELGDEVAGADSKADSDTEDAGKDDRDLLGDADKLLVQAEEGPADDDDSPYVPTIGRITILGEEWEHEALTSYDEDSAGELGARATELDISGIEVTGDTSQGDQHIVKDELGQSMDPGAVDTDGAFADMFGIDELAPAEEEPSASNRQDQWAVDSESGDSAEPDEARSGVNDRQGHIEMQQLHLKSVQEGISWELFADGVLSRLGINEHSYGAAEDLEGAAQLDKTFTPSLRPFRDDQSGEIHQRLSLAAITEVNPDQGIRRFSFITVGSIDHLGILRPMNGVSDEDARAVHEKAERLLSAKKDGFLPDLDYDLISISNPFTGITRA